MRSMLEILTLAAKIRDFRLNSPAIVPAAVGHPGNLCVKGQPFQVQVCHLLQLRKCPGNELLGQFAHVAEVREYEAGQTRVLSDDAAKKTLELEQKARSNRVNKLVRSNETHWGSRIVMGASVYKLASEIKDAIEVVCGSSVKVDADKAKTVKNYLLDYQQLRELKDICDILQPATTLTHSLGKSTYSTVFSVYPTVHGYALAPPLEPNTTEPARDLHKKLTDQIKTRFVTTKIPEAILVAINYKNKPQQKARQEVTDYLDTITSDIDIYAPALDNPQDYWRDMEDTYPMMAQLARSYLAVQATSSECERLFSKAGQLLPAQKANLAYQNFFNMLMHNSYEKLIDSYRNEPAEEEAPPLPTNERTTLPTTD
ncbi:hypothetical protein BGZ96_012736 [Linnemannia gamsii]|uniref:HAT C-terminal dimerisation domain-containing protein n=1 Tax=Linnemannia gamsii TaxID=64522 RepID=A0ABQ7JPU9_9FUNG|nr:hypothetical protein BGZ96_012736 [Linnemannia gamsii]